MTLLPDLHSPSFKMGAVNNNRTAWRPVSEPVILTVPHRRDASGTAIANSQVFNVRVYIEDVPKEALVAGHDHVGIRYPDKELYAVTLNAIELAEKQMDLNGLIVTRDGAPIDWADAKTGDTIEFTTATGVAETIQYIEGANYYDLSDVSIDVELLPSDNYNLVYSCEYFTRVVSDDGQEDLLCIDASSISMAILRFRIAHPGAVMDEFHRFTPPPYLTNTAKAQDTTLQLYRPFTDTLQDVADEQDLLESINWVFDTPPEAIPYLSQLLGWDLPYFPKSLDQMRRAVLRRTVELQNIKGSRRAIIDIFRLFGFEIMISNLWWSSDGKMLIRPDASLPTQYKSQEIITREQCQIDILLEDWCDTTFGQFQIPLLKRPQELSEVDNFTALRDGGPVAIDAYLVERGSEAQLELQAIADEIKAAPLDYGSTAGCLVDDAGMINPTAIHNRLIAKEVIGYSQILISGKLGQAVSQTLAGNAPITIHGAVLDRDDNVLTLTLTSVFDETYSIYAFATYKRQEFIVPDIIANLQSNRFDITVATENLQSFADPPTLEFAIEFLYKLKAFHSLLNVIRQRIELTETYEVTDLCVGGDITQRYDTDIGVMQVPPAIIPNIEAASNPCTADPKSLGYKDSDLLLRMRKLTNLEEEVAAAAALDNRTPTTGDTRVAPLVSERSTFKYNQYAQDRVVSPRIEAVTTQCYPGPNANNAAGCTTNTEIAPHTIAQNGQYASGLVGTTNNDSSAYGSFTREYAMVRQPWPVPDDRTDYCYKGRVGDELLYMPVLSTSEYYHQNPCNIRMGTGVYYTYPAYAVKIGPGNINRTPGSLSRQASYSGRSVAVGIRYYLTDQQKEYLDVSYATPLPVKNNSFLGRLYRDYSTPPSETLHFTNRRFAISNDQRQQLALMRPSLQIEKSTMHLPGCRFPRLNALDSDFTHPTYLARPWDDPYSTYCGQSCAGEPTFLHAFMIASGGNETLSFDSVPYSVVGNSLTPDIPSLGDHSLGTGALFDSADVVHRVYMSGAGDNPAVELDQVCDYDTNVVDGIIAVDDPLFHSHGECSSSISDFADGYACVSGYQSASAYDLDRSGLNTDLLSGLGVPLGAPSTYLIALGSGIRHERAFRLDCGCLVVGCGTSGTADAESSSICTTGAFYDRDGNLDVDSDHLEVDLRLIADESFGVCGIRLDGQIPTLLEVS